MYNIRDKYNCISTWYGPGLNILHINSKYDPYLTASDKEFIKSRDTEISYYGGKENNRASGFILFINSSYPKIYHMDIKVIALKIDKRFKTNTP